MMEFTAALFRRRFFAASDCVLALAFVFVACGVAARAESTARQRLDEGRELFLREWTPADSRSHGGDGLGPVFNDTSCVACHNAGGTGGGGPSSKNVDIITAIATRAAAPAAASELPRFLSRVAEALTGIEAPPPAEPTQPRKPDTTALVKAHAGFRTARSVVLHRFGLDPNYEGWRRSMLGESRPGFRRGPEMLGVAPSFSKAQAEIDQIKSALAFPTDFRRQQQIGEFIVLRSQRNPTALYGAGLIDAIPDEVLEAAAEHRDPDHPGIAGRVSRQKDGRIGRFGWKAQTPRLDDFVRTACAVELGLDVPGHHQGGLPQSPETKPTGLDLSDNECGALLAYVASLPKPTEIVATSVAERQKVTAGKAAFERVGCAACHMPTLGNVDGIYSDLLLHDMGPETGDTGAYGAFVPDSSEPDVVDSDPPGVVGTTTVVTTPRGPTANRFEAKRPTGPATRQEWRTPPLWGFRDSGPYLHDGRAATLDEAIAMHGGEAAGSAREYFSLPPAERQQVTAFLKTLTAPTPEAGR
jgi:CxxC motif-containing protein (DUF1111 family)